MDRAQPFRSSDSAELFRLALQAAPTGMLMADRQGRITFANAQIEKLFGYTREELIGSQLERLVPARYLQQHPQQQALRPGGYFEAPQEPGAGQDLYGLHKDGTQIPLEIGLTPMNMTPMNMTPVNTAGELVLYSIVDITRRKRSEQQLRERTADLVASLKERDVLLQEIHHRVKNNLQVISSLINMQIRKLDASASREALKECKTRIEVISLIHQKLYQATNFANVQFADYARSLASNVLHAGDATERITLEFAFENIALPVDKAIPCGLILNELLTNVVKHAYPGRDHGTVRMTLRRLPAKRLQIEVSDRGVGMSGPHPQRAHESIGLQLISTLAEQLQGELRIDVNEGTCVQVDFPYDPPITPP